MPLTLATLHSASFLRSHTVTHSTGGVKGMVVVSLKNRQAHECSRACVVNVLALTAGAACCALGLVPSTRGVATEDVKFKLLPY